jgi:hypothetical protein
MDISQRIYKLKSKRFDLQCQIDLIDQKIVQLQSEECQHSDVEHSDWWGEWGYDQHGDGTRYYERLNTCNECGYSWHETKSANEYNETE